MSGEMLGADPAQLRELAKTMSSSQQKLSSISSTLTAAISQTQWQGPDANSFRQRWSTSMRPSLSKVGIGLYEVATNLKTQATEQEKASEAGGGSVPTGGGSGPTGGGGGREWTDPFTDPNYQHAPGGVEWLFEKIFGGDGGQASAITNALKFVADKFGWNIELGMKSFEEFMPKFASGMKIAGKVLGVIGGALGVLDILSGIENKDGFRIADGTIAAALSVAALTATGTIVGAPAGVVIGAVALLWGGASMLSGDVPVTKRIWDAGAWTVDRFKDLGNGISDGIGWLGGKLGFG